ncbi:hypothetical protein P9112_002826 [Eukaryota sp. TZLM1-RC]
MGALLAKTCHSKSLVTEIEQEINNSHHSSFGTSLNSSMPQNATDLQSLPTSIDMPSDDEDDFLRLDGFIDSSTFDLVQAFALGHQERNTFHSPVKKRDSSNLNSRSVNAKVTCGTFVDQEGSLVQSPFVHKQNELPNSTLESP